LRSSRSSSTSCMAPASRARARSSIWACRPVSWTRPAPGIATTASASARARTTSASSSRNVPKWHSKSRTGYASSSAWLHGPRPYRPMNNEGRRDGPGLKARAIAYLSRREHSRLELQRKLAAYSDDAAQIEAVLDELKAQHWQSDERYAEANARRQETLHGTAL